VFFHHTNRASAAIAANITLQKRTKFAPSLLVHGSLVFACRRKHRGDDRCWEDSQSRDRNYEKNANICRLRNLYFRNSLRQRGNS
jgi:hypothetical protein